MTDFFDDVVESPEQPSRRSRRQLQSEDQERRGNRRRNILTLVFSLGALAAIIIGAVLLIRPLLQPGEREITDYPGPGSGAVEIIVATGDSGAAIGSTLVDADVVATQQAFVSAYNANPNATRIQAGTYELKLQMRAADAVAALLDSGNRTDITITIPESWRATQIYNRVAEVLDVDVAEVEEAAGELELPESAEGNPEGWLYATTYSVDADSTPLSVLQRMVDETNRVLSQLDVPEEDRQDLLNKASIVELEMHISEERPLVAQVIENRLAGCSHDGTLGMDTTYAYGLGIVASQITREQWREPHPYNTRRVPGLPPTPIGSPSLESIEASLNPPEGNYCYFLTVNPDTSETRFTDSLAEHEANQEEYRKWREEKQAASPEVDDAEDAEGSEG